jgi:hypothetical protein
LTFLSRLLAHFHNNYSDSEVDYRKNMIKKFFFTFKHKPRENRKGRVCEGKRPTNLWLSFQPSIFWGAKEIVGADDGPSTNSRNLNANWLSQNP